MTRAPSLCHLSTQKTSHRASYKAAECSPDRPPLPTLAYENLSSYPWCGGRPGTAVTGGKCPCAGCGPLAKHSVYCMCEGMGVRRGCLRHQIRGTLLSKSNSQGLSWLSPAGRAAPVAGFPPRERPGNLRVCSAVSSHLWPLPGVPAGAGALISQRNSLTLYHL